MNGYHVPPSIVLLIISLAGFGIVAVLLGPILGADNTQIMLMLGVITLGVGQLIKLIVTEKAAQKADTAASKAEQAAVEAAKAAKVTERVDEHLTEVQGEVHELLNGGIEKVVQKVDDVRAKVADKRREAGELRGRRRGP